MSTAHLAPMAEADLEAWRASRSAAGDPLPEPRDGTTTEAHSLVVDGVTVGGAVLDVVDDPSGRRCAVRVLQTTLPHDAAGHWAAVVEALVAHARLCGAAVVTTAVAPGLAGAFGAAGFRATMTTVGKPLAPGAPTELQDDQRVSVRPMDEAERAQFVVDVAAQLRDGMARAGVVDRGGSSVPALEERVRRLAHDPPPAEELLVTATVDGVPVGRAWLTLVERDGVLDVHGNTLDLFPEHRGQRLTPSFLGALRRLLDELGVHEVRMRVYAHDGGARRTFLDEGAGIHDVHLRKDLRPDPPS